MTNDELLLDDYLSYETFASGLDRNNPIEIIVHHTGGTDADPLADTSNQTFEIVEAYHKVRFKAKTLSSLGFYLGYHFFIDKKGKRIQAREYTDLGAHTIGENARSIAVCLAGNFDATHPTPEQVASLKALLIDILTKYKGIPQSEIHPHRHFAIKTCYGKHLSDDWARSLLSPVSVSPPEKEIEVSIPKPTVTTTQENVNTFNLFAFIFNLCKKLFVK